VGTGDIRRAVHPQRRGIGRFGGPEGGELVLPIRDDRNAQSFQNLQCFGEIEDCLGPGGNHSHRRLRQLVQVSRDIERGFGPLMHPADAAGCKHLDPGMMRGDHGGGNRGGAGPARGHAGRHVRAGQLGDTLRLA